MPTLVKPLADFSCCKYNTTVLPNCYHKRISHCCYQTNVWFCVLINCSHRPCFSCCLSPLIMLSEWRIILGHWVGTRDSAHSGRLVRVQPARLRGAGQSIGSGKHAGAECTRRGVANSDNNQSHQLGAARDVSDRASCGGGPFHLISSSL